MSENPEEPESPDQADSNKKKARLPYDEWRRQRKEELQNKFKTQRQRRRRNYDLHCMNRNLRSRIKYEKMKRERLIKNHVSEQKMLKEIAEAENEDVTDWLKKDFTC